MPNIVAIATSAVYLFGEGQNENLPRLAALCAAVLAAIALAIAVAWHATAHADGGASARSQATAPAPDDSGATTQAYAQLILRALSDDSANNWVRYWQARAACDAITAQDASAASLDLVLLTLATAICARLDARIGVDPAAHMPRGEERTVGLVASEPGAAAGYTLFTGDQNQDVFLIDPLGRVVHSWHMPGQIRHAKLLDNGNLLVNISSGIVEFAPDGDIIWEYRVSGLHHDFHDFLKMPSGNVMMIGWMHKTRDEAIAAGANAEFVHEDGIKYDRLIEARPTGAKEGEVVWEWSPWDHLIQDFDSSKPNYGKVAEHPELIDLNFLLELTGHRNLLQGWTHINTIDYNSELDQVMLSPRNFSELWIIDHSATTEEARGHSGGNSGMGGDLLYRWGNPQAYGQGDGDDQRLFRQHHTHWIAPGLPGEGNILVFNNGWGFAGNERFYSSVDEIAPPVDEYRYRRDEDAAYPPDGLEWTYIAETRSDFYSHVRSGTQRLPNGNTLIVDGNAGTIFQATPDGRMVWKYVSPIDRRAHMRQGEPVLSLDNAVYRAYWYPPDHPGLQALDLTPGAYIEDMPDIYDITHAAIISGDFGERLADSDFDIYLDENEDGDRRWLIYFKQPCAAADTQAKFFLHIIPADARDLRADRQEYGFNTRGFEFKRRGKVSDGWCVAVRALPDYPIERIRTGQFTDAGRLWQTEITLNK